MTTGHTPTPAEPVSAAVPRWFARHGSLIACPPGTHCDCVNPCTPVVKLQDVADTVERHDALVAALEMARAQVELRKEDARAAGGLFSGFDAKLAQIDAALKAAKGEA